MEVDMEKKPRKQMYRYILDESHASHSRQSEEHEEIELFLELEVEKSGPQGETRNWAA